MKESAGELCMRQEGQFLEIRPALEGLKQVLHTRVHVPQRDTRGFLSVHKVPSPLYRERADEDGPVLDCLAGLLPVVLRFAARAGYAARIQRLPVARLPEPDFQCVEHLGPLDRGFLRCVQQHDRALVRYEPSTVTPAWLVAQVALAWPQRTIAVAVTRIGEARQLRDQLRKYLPGVVTVTSRNWVPDADVGRVVVATYNGLGNTGIEVEKRHIVLALNAVEASRPSALSCLGHAKRARVYGLLPGRQLLAPYDQDVVRLLFGFREVEVLRHGAPEVRVKVVWCRKVGCPALAESTDLVEVKRQGLWRNHARNRQIARLARRLQAGDSRAIGKDLPLSAPCPGFCNLAVLVENVEHAEALARYLPGWLVAANRPGAHSAVTGDRQGVIATESGIAELGQNGAAVLVRADSGVGLPPGQILLREKNLPETHCCEHGLLLVDIEDRHHPLLRRWGRQRRAAYAERGWYAPGVDPVRARVERFLSTRG